jgi:hypothetical protein
VFHLIPPQQFNALHTNILVMISRPAYSYTFKRTLMLALKSSSQSRNLLHKA